MPGKCLPRGWVEKEGCLKDRGLNMSICHIVLCAYVMKNVHN